MMADGAMSEDYYDGTTVIRPWGERQAKKEDYELYDAEGEPRLVKDSSGYVLAVPRAQPVDAGITWAEFDKKWRGQVPETLPGRLTDIPHESERQAARAYVAATAAPADNALSDNIATLWCAYLAIRREPTGLLIGADVRRMMDLATMAGEA